MAGIHTVRVPEGVMPMGTGQCGYIYCIRLPFVSNTAVIDPLNVMQQEVVKVGHSISAPAGRLREIMDVFNQLGIKEDLLQDIDKADTPETAIQKAKLHRNGSIIFIMKVAGTKQEIEEAEGKIREVLEPSPLGNNFIESFKSHFDHDEKKKAALEKHTGMSEWILADSGIIAHLQIKFCTNQLCDHRVIGQHQNPSGKVFCRQLIARCIEHITNRKLKIPPSVVISFQPTSFQSEPLMNDVKLIQGYELKIIKALQQ